MIPTGYTVLGFAKFLGEWQDEPDIDIGFCEVLGAVVGQAQ